MRAKRWGRAGHGREQPRRKVILLAVLAGLLVCLVLPVRAQKKTGKLCFPLDTTQYRVSDGYGWRQDPFTGERTFHKGIDLACAEGTEVLPTLHQPFLLLATVVTSVAILLFR